MEKIIDITRNALDFFKKSVADEKCLGIRIDVASGGCQGMSYSIDFVKKIDEADVFMAEEDLNVYIAPRATIFVAGMTVDYTKNAMGGNIVFENPNAKQTCSCGRSFQTDESGNSYAEFYPEGSCSSFCNKSDIS
ncbi:MAG: iron-sulfur cluster assembly accessory protein [Holosporaceae bacterium]|jgi:iron-sulfur cluster assembly accessory protein|nr:iron-sulfur cluster assembly accessory protein [Holosporaceae bacterium]